VRPADHGHLDMLQSTAMIPIRRLPTFLLVLLAAALCAPVTVSTAQADDTVHLFVLAGQSNMSFDPTKDFAEHVQAALPGRKIVVVQHAVGGQGIWHWYKDWKLEGEPLPGLPGKSGETYDALLKKVAASGVDVRSAASVSLIWMQGETDARNERACHVYEQSLRGLIQQFRQDLGREDLRVVIGRINDAQMKRESWQIVRAAQVAGAKADPLATWIDSDDLNGDDNNVHNNAAGKQELGRRFANAAVELINAKADKVRVLFVANSYSLWNHQPRLLEEFIKAGQKREAEVMPFTSAGAPLSWHLKDGRAMKWLTGDTKDFVAGADERVVKLRDKIASDPEKGESFVGPAKITLKDQLREKEVELYRAKDGRWDFVFLLFFTDDYAADEEEIRRRVKTIADAAREHKVTPIVWLPWGGRT
jgi:hypothetical protein